MKHRTKPTVNIVCIIVMLFFLTSCKVYQREEANEMMDNYRPQDSTNESIRNDTEKLKEWFPNLKGIVSAEWEIYTDSKNDYPELPAPGSFSAKGYITIDAETAEEYLQSYEWSSAKPEVKMKYVSPDKMENASWLYSWQFDNDVRPQSFIGYFWFDGETVLFDVGK